MLKKLFSKKDIAVTVKRLARLIEKDFPAMRLVLSAFCILKSGRLSTIRFSTNITNSFFIDGANTISITA